MADLQDLALKIAEWFPELGGRSLAVSEVDPFNDKTNIPTLPLAIVSLVRETGGTGTSTSTIQLTQSIAIEFMLKTERYKTGKGHETPFYSFYDFDGIRDRLLAGLRQIGGYQYVSLDVESDEFAVYLSFRFNHVFKWCEPEPEKDCEPDTGEGQPARLTFSILAPKSPCFEPDLECETEKEDC